MDKNTIIGLVLIAAVLIGFSWYNTNQERNLQQIPTEQTASAPSNDNKPIAKQAFIMHRKDRILKLHCKTIR